MSEDIDFFVYSNRVKKNSHVEIYYFYKDLKTRNASITWYSKSLNSLINSVKEIARSTRKIRLTR